MPMRKQCVPGLPLGGRGLGTKLCYHLHQCTHYCSYLLTERLPLARLAHTVHTCLTDSVGLARLTHSHLLKLASTDFKFSTPVRL